MYFILINKMLTVRRLASSMLSRQQTKQQQTQSNNTNSLSAKAANEPAVSPEIQTSIKEVTSAIVHYVNDQTNRTTTNNSRSRSASPSKYVQNDTLIKKYTFPLKNQLILMISVFFLQTLLVGKFICWQ